VNLRNLDRDELRDAVAPLGVPGDVAARLFAHVQRDGAAGLAHGDVRGMTKDAARALADVAEWPDLEILERRRAADGFVKYLFRTADGHAIEAVRIPLPDPADARELKARRREARAAREAGRGGMGEGGVPRASALEALPTAKYTLCVSSQVGCALACDFCATGRMGGVRSLKTWEILAQHRLVAAEADHPLRGVVFMGMGEPLLNYENVIRAARILSDPAGPAIAAKAISISTAGVVPMIRRFTAEGHRYRLLVSLGAPTSEQRRALMPIEDRWPLPELMDALRAHAAATGQRIPIAYVAIGGVNTSPAHARDLAALVAGLRVKLNLIDVVDETGAYRPPTPDELATFRDALDALGAPVVRRYSGGKDIAAACGTLAASRTGGDLVPLRARASVASESQ